MLSGYIKSIRRLSAAPAELYFTATGEGRRYSLEEGSRTQRGSVVPEKRRSVPGVQPTHRRGPASRRATRCGQRTGTHHQIIASACSIDHARQVRSIYEECGYRGRCHLQQPRPRRTRTGPPPTSRPPDRLHRSGPDVGRRVRPPRIERGRDLPALPVACSPTSSSSDASCGSFIRTEPGPPRQPGA